jgi:hypothetical protein
MNGATNFLGTGNQQTLAIVIDYPKELDLLHKKTIPKQQNHYIWHKDTIQMMKKNPSILKTSRSRSLPPTGT